MTDPSINTRQMRYMLMIEKEKKIYRAAEKCFISQSAMSQHLAAIEKQYGCRIFRRVNNSWVPTPEGRSILAAYRKILAITEELSDRLEAMETDRKATVTLSIPTVREPFIFPDLYQAFRKEFPDNYLKLIQRPMTDIPRTVAKGEARIGFFFPKSDIPLDYDTDLTFETICDEELVLLCSRRHPLSEKAQHSGTLPLEDLNGETLVSLMPSFTLQKIADDFFLQHHITIRESITFGSIETAIHFVADVGTPCLLPPMFLRSLYPAGKPGDDIIAVPIRPAPVYQLGLIYSRNRSLSSLERRTIALAREVISARVGIDI
ncbi:MAG: LysR family transcriptional regulator [Lachnospiraceae bacterium]|nr:LysR family transcriptional regulator [Lachnospiraceae bacterium]